MYSETNITLKLSHSLPIEECIATRKDATSKYVNNTDIFKMYGNSKTNSIRQFIRMVA